MHALSPGAAQERRLGWVCRALRLPQSRRPFWRASRPRGAAPSSACSSGGVAARRGRATMARPSHQLPRAPPVSRRARLRRETGSQEPDRQQVSQAARQPGNQAARQPAADGQLTQLARWPGHWYWGEGGRVGLRAARQPPAGDSKSQSQTPAASPSQSKPASCPAKGAGPKASPT